MGGILALLGTVMYPVKGRRAYCMTIRSGTPERAGWWNKRGLVVYGVCGLPNLMYVSFRDRVMFCHQMAYPSRTHGSAKTFIRSGRVLAISLYTLQLLANLLSPPSAAGLRQ